ncbi:hypothetical protein ACTWJ8_40025 (plasmid) [Streptomyces sp. SDT5-1]|uniref:hypothetical protein n=1 Tax=Streptomyces sp. SDT5-1 TaxID=3406418 RepID=UPI003FD630FB
MSPARQGFGGLIERGPMAVDVLGAHYTTVFNQAVRDQRLSRRARGLLVELLSHRDGYGISLAMLVKNGPEGKDALTSALHELETHGYLHRERERDARGRLGETRYYLTDMPQGAEIIAQAPWDTGLAPAAGTAGTRSRRSEPEPGNPPQAEPDQNAWSEPKSDFPAQAAPAQAEPPHKKTNRKKTKRQNPNPLPPSGQAPRHGRDGGQSQEVSARGESVLLSIARHHPELHSALATGSTLADQAPLVGKLLEAGVSREHIREALVGRPYPPPQERTHSLAALVAARLQHLKRVAVAAEHARSAWNQPAPVEPATPAPHPDLDVAVPPKPECPGQDGLCGRPVSAPGDLCPRCQSDH